MNAPMRHESGLTLLELVLALALASSVVLGAGWWMRTATARATKTNALLRRESTTNALFNAIDRDLESGDLATDAERLPKVRVRNGVLSLLTRSLSSDLGAVFREYELKPTTGELLETERPADPAGTRGAAPPARVVLGNVKSFEANVDEKARTLSVQLVAQDGTSNSRRWALP